MCLTMEGGRSKGTCLVENKQGKIQNNKNTMQNKENKLLENMHTEKQRNFQLDPPSFRHNHIHCLFFNTAKGAVAMLIPEQLIPHNVWSQLTHIKQSLIQKQLIHHNVWTQQTHIKQSLIQTQLIQHNVWSQLLQCSPIYK